MEKKIKIDRKAEEPMFIVIDLFCGAGGVTTGFVQALLNNKKIVKVVACINHDHKAILSHWANNPEVKHFEEDIRNLDLSELVALVEFYRKQYPNAKIILWASLECFVAGTMIVTKRGLVDIKDIVIGDYVLTHKGRYKKVTDTMSKKAYTKMVRAQGLPELETTNEHPFYTRQKTKVWDNSIRQYKNKYSPASWITTDNLKPKSSMLASPLKFPVIEIPEVGGRGFEFSNEFWWLIGRWLGDGSISNRGKNKQITISCGKHEHQFLLEKFKEFLPVQKRSSKSEVRMYDREVRTAINFDFFHTGLAEWLLEYFGKGATGKTIPSWVYSMHEEWREALLQGYISADGTFDGNLYQCTTVSKRLALGIKMIAQTLGHSVTLNKYPARGNKIEGRIVNDKPFYHLAWRKIPELLHTISDDKHIWGTVKRVTSTYKQKEVYNISVEEDESYVADGIVVHNCTNFSNAKGGLARDEDSRTLAHSLNMKFDILKNEHIPGDSYMQLIKPDYLMIENVREFKQWGPSRIKMKNGKPVRVKNKHGEWVDGYEDIPERRGEIFKQWCKDVCALGYVQEWRMLNSADFGAYTSRNRLFGVFAKPDLDIIWPEPTHHKTGKGGLKKWKAVKEKLDFDDEGYSIFHRGQNLDIPKRYRKDLSPNTLDRIYAGCIKHIAGGKKAFLAKYNGTFEGQKPRTTDTDQPLGVIATGFGNQLVQPAFISKYYSGVPYNKNISVEGPAGVIKTSDGQALVQTIPFIVQRNSGEPESKVVDVNSPARTITKTGGNQDLVQAFISTYHGNGDNTFSVDVPAPAIAAADINAAVFIDRPFSAKAGTNSSIENPAGAITPTLKMNMISAKRPEFNFLDSTNYDNTPKSVEEPAGVITANRKYPYLMTLQYGGHIHSVEKPSPVIVATAHKTPLYLFITDKGEAQIKVFETDSEVVRKLKEFMVMYGIIDIKMRMLRVDELLTIQGFPDDYRLAGTQADQKKFIGNSVVPQVVKSWIEAMGMNEINKRKLKVA